jgi:hypothetical protein
MQNASASASSASSNTMADNLALLVDMGFSEQQSKEVDETGISS